MIKNYENLYTVFMETNSDFYKSSDELSQLLIDSILKEGFSYIKKLMVNKSTYIYTLYLLRSKGKYQIIVDGNEVFLEGNPVSYLVKCALDLRFEKVTQEDIKYMTYELFSNLNNM